MKVPLGDTAHFDLLRGAWDFKPEVSDGLNGQFAMDFGPACVQNDERVNVGFFVQKMSFKLQANVLTKRSTTLHSASRPRRFQCTL